MDFFLWICKFYFIIKDHLAVYNSVTNKCNKFIIKDLLLLLLFLYMYVSFHMIVRICIKMGISPRRIQDSGWIYCHLFFFQSLTGRHQGNWNIQHMHVQQYLQICMLYIINQPPRISFYYFNVFIHEKYSNMYTQGLTNDN